MAAGLVPITTQEAAEAFDSDSYEGYVVGYRSADSIYYALSRLLSDPSELRHTAQAARAKAETQTWQAFKEAFAGHIRALTGGGDA